MVGMSLNTDTAEISEIPRGLISPRNNDRTVFDPTELHGLSESLRSIGILQPIVVRPAGDGTFELVAGERRWRAAGIAGLETVPCVVRCFDDDEAGHAMLAENTGRVDLNPVDEGAAYSKRADAGVTVAEIAKVAGVPAATVSKRIRVHRGLGATATDAYRTGALSLQHAAEICVLDEARQQIVADAAVRGNLSVKQLRDLMSKMRTRQAEEAEEGMFTLEEYRVACGSVVDEVKAPRASKNQIAETLRELAGHAPPGLAEIALRHAEQLSSTCAR